MPIVSRNLASVQQSGGGTVLVLERAIDNQGREWIHGRRRVANEAQAITEMDARDWTSQLQEREELDAVKFVQAGGDPDAFIRFDLTASQLARLLIIRFMRQRLDDDKSFMLRFAQWLVSKTATQVARFLDVSVARAQAMIDRASDLVGIRMTLDTDDGRVEKLD